MRKYWMLGLFGGLALSMPAYSGDVKTDDKLDVDITVGGQFRARYDYRDNLTYSQGARTSSDDQTVIRSRLNFGIEASDDVSAFFQVQDSHVNGAAATTTVTGAPGTTGDAGLVLRQGYLNINNLFGLPLDLTAGRMALHYGHGRVLNDLDWSNSPRHFDGAKIRYSRDNDNTWIDLAYLEHQNAAANQALSTLSAPNTYPDDDYDIYIAYGHTQFQNTTLEVYNVYERDGLSDRTGEKTGTLGFTAVPDDLNRHTTGILVEHKLDNFKASFEGMWQWGNDGRDRINAEAYAFVLGYSLKDSLNTRFEYEFTQASGDKDPNDGKDGRFQSPFHFNHKYQGYADVVGFTNSRNHKLQVQMDLNDKDSLLVAWHFFDRKENDDAWYSAGGAVLHPANASGSSDMGQELDIKFNHKYSKNLMFELGYAHFMGGTLLRNSDTTLGDMDYAYLQAVVNF